MLQAQEASEGVAALKPVSGSAAGKAFDGDDHDSEDQGNEGFDEEEEEEEEEDGDAALGSPMKKDAAGRTPRRNSIEFLQDKSRRHITFSKRKSGILKKAKELAVLTGSQVMLVVASETGHIYSYCSPMFKPILKPTQEMYYQQLANPSSAAVSAASPQEPDFQTDDTILRMAKQINKSSSKFSGLNAQSSPNYNYLSPMTQAAIGKSDGGLNMCGGGARLAPGAEGRAGINEFLQFQTQMLHQQQQQHNTDVAAQIKELSARHRALGQFYPQSAGLQAGSSMAQQFQRDSTNQAAAKAAGSFDSGFPAAGDSVDDSFSWFPALPGSMAAAAVTATTTAAAAAAAAAAPGVGSNGINDRKRIHGGAGAPALYQANEPPAQQSAQEQQQLLLQAMLDRKISDAVAACGGAGGAGWGGQATALTDSVSKYIRGIGDAL